MSTGRILTPISFGAGKEGRRDGHGKVRDAAKDQGGDRLPLLPNVLRLVHAREAIAAFGAYVLLLSHLLSKELSEAV